MPLPQQAHENLPQSSQLEFDSSNFLEAIDTGNIDRTETGLLNVVALLGSTHDQAKWREEGVIPMLHEKGIKTYNPNMRTGWNEHYEQYINAEVKGLGESAVIAFGIENKSVENGSLGSMVEIGLTALNSKLMGQRVVIYLEEGLEHTLTGGAKAQFAALYTELEDLQKKEPTAVQLIRGKDYRCLLILRAQIR